ncbi:hypothetical protein V8E53_007627 [Lactarius tabidus]
MAASVGVDVTKEEQGQSTPVCWWHRKALARHYLLSSSSSSLVFHSWGRLCGREGRLCIWCEGREPEACRVCERDAWFWDQASQKSASLTRRSDVASRKRGQAERKKFGKICAVLCDMLWIFREWDIASFRMGSKQEGVEVITHCRTQPAQSLREIPLSNCHPVSLPVLTPTLVKPTSSLSDITHSTQDMLFNRILSTESPSSRRYREPGKTGNSTGDEDELELLIGSFSHLWAAKRATPRPNCWGPLPQAHRSVWSTALSGPSLNQGLNGSLRIPDVVT